MSGLLRNLSFVFILLIGFAGSYLGYSIYLFIVFGLFLLIVQVNYLSRPLILLKKDLIFLGLIIFGLISNIGNYLEFFQRLLYPWIITIIFQNIVISKKHINTIFILLGVALFYQVFKMTFYDISGNLSFDYMRLLHFSHTEFYFSKGETISTTFYGTYVALLFFIVFINYKFNRTLSGPKVLLIVFLVILNVIASKRAYWFAIMLSSVIILFYNNKSYGLYFRYLFVLISIITVVFIITPYLRFVNMNELFYRFESFVNSGKAEASMSNRYYRWGLALGLILKNPFGFGFNYFYETFHVGTTHNEYLAYAVGYGVVGLLFYVMLIVSYYKLILKNFTNDFYYLKLLGLSLLIFITIIGFTENFSFSNLSFNLYTWVILGLQGNPYVNNKRLGFA